MENIIDYDSSNIKLKNLSHVDFLSKGYVGILNSEFTLKGLWLSNDFREWYDNVLPKIKILLSESTIENEGNENCYDFWIKNVYILYFVYVQLQNNNHINFSFREDDSSNWKIVKIHRKYVHTISNIMLQLFPNYRIRPTRKANKKRWNDGYQSDEYDEKNGTWDNKSYETGPCHVTWTMYYISLFLKNKNHYQKEVYAISFVEKDITISKLD